jgi:hypothetical protein
MPNHFLFRSIVGVLQYVTITRPDIAFAINLVSQFMHCPTLLHQGIQLRSSTDLTLHVYLDSDWAGCPDDIKLTTRYLVFLGPNLIS